jgi:acyl-CoA synthetase (AMP-forming)/AMP-acid ligase II
VFPQGHSVEFVLQVLRAWRAGAVVCPLEPAQPPNSKSEIRNPKEIRNSKLEIVSEFEIRDSSLAAAPPCVHLKTTSATTGQPRLIAFTASQLAADAEQIVAGMGLRPDWPNLALISMAHSYGFSNLVLPLLLHGIPMIIGPSSLPEAIRQATQMGMALTLPAVPALWKLWHEAGVLSPCIRLAISAGAPLPLALEQAVFAHTGLKIHNFYGSSECGGIAYDASALPRQDEACVGRALDHVKLDVNSDGCLVVRGPAVGETYWPGPSPALGLGTFHTSDLVELKDGQVYLRGRLSDQINVAGRKVWPAAIERVLGGHERVGECLVFGVPSPDPGRGDTIVACVAARGAVTDDELRQFLLRELPAWQVPRDWWFVENLAADARGKTSRANWRRRYLERRKP